MQDKRRQILDILKKQGSATIRNLSDNLGISGVTVRYHLEALRERDLVSKPQVCHSNHPGRPQFEYSLTPKANEYFPKGFVSLCGNLLLEMKAHTDSRTVQAIMSGVTRRVIADAPKRREDISFEEHIDSVVDYLNSKGYMASWEKLPDGIMLHTKNCPYEGVAEYNPEMCRMDDNMFTSLLGVTPKCVGHLADGNDTCAYMIAESEIAACNQ